MGPTGRRAATVSVTATLLIASTAACGGDSDDGGAANAPATSGPSASPTAAEPASTEVTTSSPPGRNVDGVLTIGTLLPVTGAGNQIGIAGINAVNIGIREINNAGGVLGQPVQQVNASEGTTADEARAGKDTLLAGNVDAVIGPASSLVALEVLDELMAAGVLVCSPTATALALNDYPDRDLFFRTVPSDSLTAQAMAAMALNTGVDSYAVVYLDDQFGRPFAQQAIGRLTGPEAPELRERPFSSDATPEELAQIATELAELAPRTILLIADSAHGWPMLQAMSDVFPTDPPFIFINDAMRAPPSTDVVVDLPPEFRERIQGVSPVVPPLLPPDGTELPGAYATNTLDCVNLIALATVRAGTDDPTAIAAEMIDASVAGTLCNSFAVCLAIAEEDRNFNYQGPNAIDFSTRGDPARGRIGMFRFDASGLDVPDAPATITELAE
jgi:branched-chain amino acid transport system substrate-binding protein